MGEHPSFKGLPPGEPIMGTTYRADGWAYVDPPGRLSPKAWDQFLAIIGEGNYQILAMSSGTHPSDGLPFIRGQLLVSPAGWQNMEAARRPHA
jgi:hypothetical protein